MFVKTKKGKTAFFFTLESLSNKLIKLNFLLMGTLKVLKENARDSP